FAGKKSAQIREILISESAWEEMTCLFAPSLGLTECDAMTAYTLRYLSSLTFWRYMMDNAGIRETRLF
ncbi:hypothetical protein M2E53_28630, partial [Klebsiella pneumoniae]|nr:hypothetical protein [Klebsiella pneumoniae]MDZ3711618.1 hypothetical protein [Klebsiella pneumoniae]